MVSLEGSDNRLEEYGIFAQVQERSYSGERPAEKGEQINCRVLEEAPDT
jgi:hypothetical protein